MENILISIKRLFGISVDNTDFDDQLIMHINSIIMILKQIGLTPAPGFTSLDGTQTWADYLGTFTDIAAVRTYIYIRVHLLFDPPSNSFLIESLNNLYREYEWRIRHQLH